MKPNHVGGAWRLLVATGFGTGVFLTVAAIASLAYLFVSNASTERVADFGVACDPSTAVLTALYVFGTVLGQMTLGIAAAFLVFFWSEGRPLRLGAAIAILTLPYAVPSTIGLTMFEFLLAEGSTVQSLLFPAGSPLNGTWARFGVMTALGIWQFFPFIFLMTLAAFLGVPSGTLNSARSDGARPVQIMRVFLLPAALPVLVAAATLRIVLMLTKIDAPLAFQQTSSNDFACLAAVRIYTSLGISGSTVPLGLVLILCASVLLALTLGTLIQRRVTS